MHYELFQGFFFEKPELVQHKNICASHMNCSRLLNAVQQHELKRDEVAELIHTEPSLTLRLLRYLNSFAFAFRFEISSVRHALELLGEDEIRKWVLVCAVTENRIDKPSEVVVWALVRARFCEQLAGDVGDSLSGAFWMGMTSAFPVLLDVSMTTVLERLPISPAMKHALRSEPGLYATYWSFCDGMNGATGKAVPGWRGGSASAKREPRFFLSNHWSGPGW